MASYYLSNTSSEVKAAISGSHTALFGGGFAGNLRINGIVSGSSAEFGATTINGNFQNNSSSSLIGAVSISGPLDVSSTGKYIKPQHFNSGIFIGRNAAPNFLVPTLVVSGVTEFKYPVLMGGWNSSPILNISGDANVTGYVQASYFAVTGQILPTSEAVSGRIPIFNSNTGNFSRINVTGDGLYPSNTSLSTLGDFSCSSTGYFNTIDATSLRTAADITCNGILNAPLINSTGEMAGNIISAASIEGLTGSFPFKLVIATGNAPTTSTSPGVLGQIALKGSKLHICTGTNLWGTIAIGAFSA